jgi:hypothetical protein
MYVATSPQLMGANHDHIFSAVGNRCMASRHFKKIVDSLMLNASPRLSRSVCLTC